MQSDSVDKIIERYFHAVAMEPFTYRDKTFEPKPLKVSPLLLRDYTCPPGCGGCCFKFTLDYLPHEAHPKHLKVRHVVFNGRKIEVWSDAQESNETNRCQYLLKDGRCGTYLRRPFTCDFELIRSLTFADDERPNVLTQKLFGRGWSYQRTDGGKGAKCEMLPISDHAVAEVVRKLDRLKAWTDHFGLKTWIPQIQQLIKRGDLQRATSGIELRLSAQDGFGL